MLWGEEPLSQGSRSARTRKASDRSFAAKDGLLPSMAMTGAGANDTSVIRGPAVRKAGRQKTYGPEKHSGV